MSTNKQRALIKWLLLSGFVFCFMSAKISADVIYLDDGSILFASFQSASGDEMIYKNNSGEIRIKGSSILKTEPNISVLQGKVVNLILLDKSVIEGTFTDYDADIGYFIDLSFGTLTVPSDKVVRVADPAQIRKYEGSAVQLAARSLFSVPIGDNNFSYLAGGGLGAEFKLPFMRGLFAGADLDLITLKNDKLKELAYTFIQISPKIIYRYMGFRTNPGLFSRLVPFTSLGGGMTVIFIQDLRSGVSPDSYGSLSPHMKAEAGFDYFLSDNWVLKLNGTYMTVFQKDALFNTVGGNLSVCYEF